MAVNTNLSHGGQPSSSQISKLNKKAYFSLCTVLVYTYIFFCFCNTEVSEVPKQLDE